MKLKDATAAIENILPLSWCEDWDNSGLLVGDPEAEIKRVAVALDATPACLVAANGCDLLIVHHPLIFKPLKRIVADNPASRAVTYAIKNGIAVYAAHTNWDVAPDGVNRSLAKELGLLDVEPLVPAKEGAWGLGAAGRLKSTTALGDLARTVKDRWGLSWLMVHGELEAGIDRVALMGGSGGAFWGEARKKAAVYITADAGYHNILDAQSEDFPLIVTGHGEMERVSLSSLAAVIGGVLDVEPILLPENGADTTMFMDRQTREIRGE